MPWMTLATLIAEYGLPLALKLADKWGSKEAVTDADIAELKQLAAQTATTQMRDALVRAGVDPESDQGKRLLGLVGAPTAVPAPAP